MTGTCSVLLHVAIVERIEAGEFQGTRILVRTAWGEDDLWSVALETDKLPPGYHGVQELWIDGGEIHFRQEADT
jgi:hypothetical protein